MSLRLTGVVAMASDRAIGLGGTMPWHLPEDLQVFRALTTGHPVLMGRKTFESIGRALPKRQNIVLTRQRDFKAEGVVVIHDVSELNSLELMDAEVMVIGGAEIYSLLLPQISQLYVSEVQGSFEADTWFPAFETMFTSKELVSEHVGFSLFLYRA